MNITQILLDKLTEHAKTLPCLHMLTFVIESE